MGGAAARRRARGRCGGGRWRRRLVGVAVRGARRCGGGVAGGGGARQIALAGGTYTAGLLLDGGLGDSGLSLQGCGVDATVLESPGGPALAVTGSETADVSVRDLTITGGRRAITVVDGAGASGPIVIERVAVRDSLRIGVLIDGISTLVELVELTVEDVVGEGGYGWGIAVQTGQSLSAPIASPTLLRDVEVIGTEGLGILVDGGWVDMEDVTVRGVAKSDGRLGRGVMLQNWSFGSLVGLESTGNSDAAVFLESPGRPNLDDIGGPPLAVAITDSLLGPTDSSAVPGTAEEAADGLTAAQADDGGPPFDPSSFLVVLEGTELGGNARAHVLAEAIVLQVGPNNIFGKGAGFPIAVQADGVVQGIDGGAPPEPASELGPGDALQINRARVSVDVPGS